jgi:hypothetical protein
VFLDAVVPFIVHMKPLAVVGGVTVGDELSSSLEQEKEVIAITKTVTNLNNFVLLIVLFFLNWNK